MKNLCLKERKKNDPYEVWATPDGTWVWRILKKWQVDDDKPFARWLCFVTSPWCPEGEYGDVYTKEIKSAARKLPNFIIDKSGNLHAMGDLPSQAAPTNGGATTYRVAVRVYGEDEFVHNQLTFATIEAAKSYGFKLASAWTAIRSWRVEDQNGQVVFTFEFEEAS